MITSRYQRHACCGALVVLLGCSSGLPARSPEQAAASTPTHLSGASTDSAAVSAGHQGGVSLGTVQPPGWETKVPEALQPAEVQGLMLFKADVTEALLAWYRLERRWPSSIRSINEHYLLPFVPVTAAGHVLQILDGDEQPESPAYVRFTFTPDTLEYQAFEGETPLDHGRVTKPEILKRLSEMQSAMPAEGASHASIGQQLIAGAEPEPAYCLHWASLWLRRIEAYIALEGRFPATQVELDRALGQAGVGGPAVNLCEQIERAASLDNYFSLSLDPANGRWEAGFQLPDRPFRGWRYSYSINAQTGSFPARPAIADSSNRIDSSTCILAWPCTKRTSSEAGLTTGKVTDQMRETSARS